ncbi:MAG: carboxylesterase family protein, partial [Steroidobacteraceae bacterium]|nr:carboxylesterase family protein [Steroidobacteraceae bacterium]
MKHLPDPTDPRRRALLGAGAALTLVAAAPRTHAATSGPIVRTTFGRVRGIVDGDLQVFRGIRYGADTAPRRFMPPAAPE